MTGGELGLELWITELVYAEQALMHDQGFRSQSSTTHVCVCVCVCMCVCVERGVVDGGAFDLNVLQYQHLAYFMCIQPPSLR